MSDFVLTCCSTVDMPHVYLKEKDIDFIPCTFDIDGNTYVEDLGKTISTEEFYRKIKEGAMPTTSQVNIGEFINFFEPYLKNGKDILHITLSTGLSGGYNSACIAREELLARYPERKIKIVDSLGASSGSGLLVDMAADSREKGRTVEEVFQIIEDNKLNIHHWFFSTDLTHYKRGGRISSTSAFAGNLLSICPLLNMNSSGELILYEKIRGKKHVITKMVKKMEKYAEGGAEYSGKCFISHSSSYEDALMLAGLIEGNFPNLYNEIMINDIGTVIGSHTGPGTVALFFIGDKRS